MRAEIRPISTRRKTEQHSSANQRFISELQQSKFMPLGERVMKPRTAAVVAAKIPKFVGVKYLAGSLFFLGSDHRIYVRPIRERRVRRLVDRVQRQGVWSAGDWRFDKQFLEKAHQDAVEAAGTQARVK